jgi:hypothetical protein
MTEIDLPSIPSSIEEGKSEAKGWLPIRICPSIIIKPI